MPNCFNLTRKSNLDAGPVVLNRIDEEMCAHFGEKADPKRWYYEWFNIIGWKIACDRSSLQEIKTDLLSEAEKHTLDDRDFYVRLSEIAQWIDDNFVPNSWAERKT